MTLGVAKRFIYCFGGSDNRNATQTESYMDRVIRVDTSKITNPFKELFLKTPLD